MRRPSLRETRQYIRDFDRIAANTQTANELYDQMLAIYPDRVNPAVLWNSARAVNRLRPLSTLGRDVCGSRMISHEQTALETVAIDMSAAGASDKPWVGDGIRPINPY